MESLLEGYAEFYSAELAEKVVRGMTENALKCKYNGGSIPMGYAIDGEQHFQIDPASAPVVIEIFKLYSKGTSMQTLVNMLNERNIKSSRGGKITLNIVNHILKNRRYIGEYSYRDVIQPDAIPAIVPQELFDRVQERMAKNKKAPARHKAEDDYLLTTKLHCGKCGAFMVGESGTSRTMKVHHYYRCVNTKKKKLCDKKAIKKDWIENLVVEQTMKVIMDDAMVLYIADMVMDLQARRKHRFTTFETTACRNRKGYQKYAGRDSTGHFQPFNQSSGLTSWNKIKVNWKSAYCKRKCKNLYLTKEQVHFLDMPFPRY